MASTSSPAPVSAADFWKLATASQLVSPTQARQWQVEYKDSAVAADADQAVAVAQWLVATQRLSRYQAKMLLAGRTGPFFYGAYQIVEKVTQGPFAGAFRALHAETRHPVLLQFIPAAVASSPETLNAMEGMISTLLGLRHTNLHRWFEYVVEGGYRFLVFEELAGKSVSEVVAEGRVDPTRACWMAQQIAEGLHILHQAGLVHGQVRPDQLWQDPSGTIHLILHGLVPMLASESVPETQQADYMAPELAQPGWQPTVQTDIYALGCCLYQFLTGQPPFPGGSAADKLRRHATEPIRPLEKLGIAPEVAQIVTFAMAKNPAVRFKSVAELITPLAALTEGEAHRMPPLAPPATLAPYLRHLDAAGTSRTTAPPPAAVPPEPVGASPPAAPPIAPPISPPAGSIPVAVAPPPPAAAPATWQVGPTFPQPAVAPDARTAPVGVGAPIRVTESRYRRRRSKNTTVWVIAASLAVVLAAVGYLVWNPQSPPGVSSSGANGTEDGAPPTNPDDNASGTATSGGSSSQSGSTASPLVADDGKMLWASPTSGQPIDFSFVPPESLLLIVVRPADLSALPEGQRLLKALGPIPEQLVLQWQSEAHIAWDDVEQLHISLHDAGEAWPRPAFVVRLKSPRSLDTLLSDWNQPSLAKSGDGEYYEGARWSFYIPTEQPGAAGSTTGAPTSSEALSAASAPAMVKVFAMGSAEEMKLVAERHGAPPPPRSGMEPLLRVSDDQRLCTVFFVPHFLRSHLLRDGREFYFGEAKKLREPLDWFLGDGIRAGAFSIHLTSQYSYVELAIIGDVTRDRYQLASDLRDRLNALPLQCEEYLARINPPEYWRRVALRFPTMIRFLHDQTRVQVENNVAIINAILPASGAHNLAFGAEMLLASNPSAPTATTVADSGANPKRVNTLEELLEQNYTVKFDQTSLEFALRDVANDVRDSNPGLPFPFDIKIIGDDLMKDGITRNQSISNFSVTDQPLSQVLTAITMRGNPITTVKDPSETDQKLVWVIGDDPDMPGRRIILITTRDGAAQRNLELPKPYQPKS